MEKFICCILGVVIMTSCGTSAADHAKSLHYNKDKETTVGLVQKHIHIGMSAAEVATQLGSPNIVTKNASRNETWIYDKIAKEVSYSSSSNESSLGAKTTVAATLKNILNITLGPIGFDSKSTKNAGAMASQERTLTVVIHFDGNSNVCDFSYHSSKF